MKSYQATFILFDFVFYIMSNILIVESENTHSLTSMELGW
jgi:hypothetical protein